MVIYRDYGSDGSYRPIRPTTWPSNMCQPEDATPRMIRAHPWYALWRHAVLQGYEERCNACGRTAVPLQAHHIWPIELYAEFAFKVGNGEALCVPCHRMNHSIRSVVGTWDFRHDDPRYGTTVDLSPAADAQTWEIIKRYGRAEWPG